MTSDNISKVVATLGEGELGVVLDVPGSKREEFQQQSSTAADYRQRLINYFIMCLWHTFISGSSQGIHYTNTW